MLYSLSLLALGAVALAADSATQIGLKQLYKLPMSGNAIMGEIYSGYYKVRSQRSAEEADLFGWFFPSQNDTTTNPVILHLGGCSAEMSIFWEHGPYSINTNGYLENNDYSWNKNASVLYIDQPFGQGFSPMGLGSTHVVNEHEVAGLLYQFLQHFFIQFPKFRELPFFIHGHDKAGHYAPVLGSYILQQNEKPIAEKIFMGKFTEEIGVSGVILGSAWVNPLIQYNTEPYARSNALVNENTNADKVITAMFSDCYEALVLEDFSYAKAICDMIVPTIIGDIAVDAKTGLSYSKYNWKEVCFTNGDFECYNTTRLSTYLNLDSVQMAINANQAITWQACNPWATASLQLDQLRDFSGTIPILLKRRIPVLVYAGMLDLATDWKSSLRMLEAIPWDYQDSFYDLPLKYWYSNKNLVAGHVKMSNGLSFIAVENGGHYLANDLPAVSQDLIQQFTNGVFGAIRKEWTPQQPNVAAKTKTDKKVKA
eukprot:gb/GEZN01004499.1/.p1 GENE.gb/GEZN01004499.1/~~gb/GEZN01004499.1/.p1  ORF type:complete len:483 (+),score=94.33 gb/GEZN01004499.1/:44-1492(+)